MDFNVETDGFEELEDDLKQMEDGLDKVEDEDNVSFEELFTKEFMRKYTDFESMESFLEHSPWTVESAEDFEAIPEDEFDDYVDENTTFEDWDSMSGTAFEVWVARQMGL